jgi:hypothetical protein
VRIKIAKLIFEKQTKFHNPVICKEQVALFVGAAFSRDHYYFAAKSRSHRDFLW